MCPNKFYTAVSLTTFLIPLILIYYFSGSLEYVGIGAIFIWLTSVGLSVFSLVTFIKLPFVTDIIKEPKEPSYKFCYDNIKKYEVGYSNEELPEICSLSPLTGFFGFRTMVLTRTYWLKESRIRDITSGRVSLADTVKDIEEIELQETFIKQDYALKVKKLNEEYEGNFIT